MRILFLGGNFAKDIAGWLEQQEDVVYKEGKVNIDDVKNICPDFIISYNYKYIIPKEIIDCVNGNAINLHISFLPYNRGAHPNIWSFLEDTPKGVTIHYIDEGIDTGDIIVQKEVFIDEEKETLKSSYEILHREIQELFKENWEKIKTSGIKAKERTGGGASTLRRTLQPLNPSLEKRDGIPRLANLEKSIANSDLRLRNVKFDDINDLFKWRNHPEIRKNSFNTNAVSWDEHERWFRAKSNDPNTAIYIAYCKEDKIGSIRFESKDDTIKISVMLNPDFLGRGFGSKVIRLGTERFIKEKNTEKPIHAEIKIDNRASIKAFQKAGYKENHLVFMYSK